MISVIRSVSKDPAGASLLQLDEQEAFFLAWKDDPCLVAYDAPIRLRATDAIEAGAIWSWVLLDFDNPGHAEWAAAHVFPEKKLLPVELPWRYLTPHGWRAVWRWTRPLTAQQHLGATKALAVLLSRYEWGLADKKCVMDVVRGFYPPRCLGRDLPIEDWPSSFPTLDPDHIPELVRGEWNELYDQRTEGEVPVSGLRSLKACYSALRALPSGVDLGEGRNNKLYIIAAKAFSISRNIDSCRDELLSIATARQIPGAERTIVSAQESRIAQQGKKTRITRTTITDIRESLAEMGVSPWYDLRENCLRVEETRVSDEMITTWREAMQTEDRFTSHDELYRVVSMLGVEHERDPVVEYLEALPAMALEEATVLVSSFAQDYLCAKGAPAYLALVSRIWFVSSVARALDPGCKVDTMLVLIGTQGVGKSTGLEALYGLKWVRSLATGRIGDPEVTSYAHAGAWCVVLDELASFRHATMEATRSWLTERQDTWRPKYGRLPKTVPRRFVVAGTTNSWVPLADPAGNRRMLPLEIDPRNVQVEKLCQDRDKLWSAAVVLYRAGVLWWANTPDSEALLRSGRQDYELTDSVVEFLRGLPGRDEGYTLMELAEALSLRATKPGDCKRLSDALRAAGWTNRRNKSKTRVWFSPEEDFLH